MCLNSDDYLLNKNVFGDVVKEICKTEYEKFSAFMGNIIVIAERCNKIGEMNNRNRDYTFDDLLNKLPVVIHLGTFFKTEILPKVGGFSVNVHYVMDYDIFLKVAKIAPIHSIPIYVSALRRHNSSKGCSDQS